MLTSLAKEEFPDAHRQLFGEGFEQRLKTRSETADTISKAARAGKTVFFGEGPPGDQQGLVEAVNSSEASGHSTPFSSQPGSVLKVRQGTRSEFPYFPAQTHDSIVSQRLIKLPPGMFLDFFLPNSQHIPPVSGRLKFFLPLWEGIPQDPWILDVVKGYQLELVSPPVQRNLPPNPKFFHRPKKML